jgi:hypothetical protein
MHSNHQQPADEAITVADKFLLWLFVFATVAGVGLGVWALFFRA